MFGFRNNNSSITVNGKTYNVQGGNISIVNGNVIVDGKVIDDTSKNSKKLEISFTGDLLNLSCDESIVVNGNVKGNIDAKGSVSCRDVGNDVKAGGSINCDDVGGNVEAGGSINCDKISGNAKAGGSIRM